MVNKSTTVDGVTELKDLIKALDNTIRVYQVLHDTLKFRLPKTTIRCLQRTKEILSKKRFTKEEVEKMIYSATIRLSDAFEVKIRELAQKPTVTREWVGEFTHEIFVWSPKKGGTLSDVVTRRLKELDIGVVE